MTKYVLFEINEICPHLIEHFIEQGCMPNFKKYQSMFNQYLTQADAEPPALEPWIQWYSVHTGIPSSEHGVFRLTEGAHAGYKDIWTAIREQGHKVMNFGSMNTARLDGDDDIFFPDPWSHEKANPEHLQPIAEFIANQVRDYTIPNHKINYFAFGKTLLENGLTITTALMALKQLVAEKFKNNKNRYQRIFVLDRIMMDMFIYYHRLFSPDFATVFSNSVAHIQHAYWRYFEPEKFSVDIERPELKDAVKNSYINMDYRLGQIMRYTMRNDIKLLIASALSQRPYLKEEQTGGRRYYRPRSIESLLEKLEIVPMSCEPVMTHQYILRFRNMGAKIEAEKILKSCKLFDAGEENQLFTVQNADNGNGLIFDCHPRHLVSEEAEAGILGKEYVFEELFYLIDEVKSGGHDPIGIFWEQAPDNQGQKMADTLMVYDLFEKIYRPFDKSRTAA